MDAPLCDTVILKTVEELCCLYHEFPLESQVWARYGRRRSPYRALILFGLSPRTRDWLLVDMCRRFFKEFPDAASLLEAWPGNGATIRDIVRKGQIPFVESAVEVMQDSGGRVPQEPEVLMRIKGVGEKVAECIIAYGWGQDALPVDGHVCRVVGRLLGTTLVSPLRLAANIRGQLKEIYLRHRGRLAARGVALIDLHELFRLHGQLVCAETPKCGQCPVSSCRFRQQPGVASTRPAVNAALWREWRELLLDGNCGKMPQKGQRVSRVTGGELYESFGI